MNLDIANPMLLLVGLVAFGASTVLIVRYPWFRLGFVTLGAILVVTGPTVIGPLLRVIKPVRKISSIVKWEGIVVDPIGAILAVLSAWGILDFPTPLARMHAATKPASLGLAAMVLGAGLTVCGILSASAANITQAMEGAKKQPFLALLAEFTQTGEPAPETEDDYAAYAEYEG